MVVVLRSRIAIGVVGACAVVLLPAVGVARSGVFAAAAPVGHSLARLQSVGPAGLRRVRRSVALPAVLKLVDRSRSIRLLGGRRVPRPVTTYLRYPPAGSGPWLLIVFGHGFASTPHVYRHLLDAWAMAGYLVAAPLFPLANADAPGGLDRDDLPNQPRDLSFVISRLLAGSASPQSPLYGLVDPSRIAVAGQSDGAMTAFAAAYEPGFRDPRIAAAVILSGAPLGNPRRFPRHSPPLLVVQGTSDRVNNPANANVLYEEVASPKFLLLLRHAAHLPPYTIPSRGLATVERATVAFLDHYLGQGPLDALRSAAARYGVGSLKSDP